MKNVIKAFSLLMVLGAIFVGCGSSNSSNGSTCSANGLSGTIVNGACSVGTAGVSGSCANPSYPYFLSSVQSPYGQIPACCNTPSVTQQTQCIQQTNTGGIGGSNGGSCIQPNGQVGFIQNGVCI
jgi:hypothetical protein